MNPPEISIPPEQLRSICGANDQYLRWMSEQFGAKVQCRGNQLWLHSTKEALQQRFAQFIEKISSCISSGIYVDLDLLSALYAACRNEPQNRDLDSRAHNTNKGTPIYNNDNPSDDPNYDPSYNPMDSALSLNGKKILARSYNQHKMLELLQNRSVIFALGPAGTGKTFLAVAYGLSRLLSGQTALLLLSRPVVEAGESLGFLPGDFTQKLGPYMMPLFDAMRYLIKPEQIAAFEAKGMIELAPLAYMRGRSLRNSIVILDEAQNATPQQVKMFLTRLGEGSQAILCGDPSQSDLGSPGKSGLSHASHRLSQVKGVGVQRFGNRDIVRSNLVQRIIGAYEKHENAQW